MNASRPLVMGILNVTPDSFSDGGRFFAHDHALRHAENLLNEGADIIDVGGESTRPGADEVSLEQELDRVVPVVEQLVMQLGATVSVDTSKAGVIAAAVQAGASYINDIRALQEPGALATAALSQAKVCLMHMQGSPRTMQQYPHYDDVVQEVKDFLAERVAACEAAGISRERLLIDPGFGFGKSLEHNLKLLKNLASLKSLGLPILIGLSRKSMFAKLLDNAPVDQRLFGGLAAALIAVQNGAKLVRTHDVKATVDALRVNDAVLTVD